MRSSSVLAAMALLAGAGLARGADDLAVGLRAHVAAAPTPLIVKLGPSEAWGVNRSAMMVPIPYTVEVPVLVPPNARLRLGVTVRETYLGDSLLDRIEPTRFAVTVGHTDGTAEDVLERVVDVRARSGDRRWIDLGVDLSRLAGERITLRLRVETAGAPDRPGKTFALWSRPRLYDVVGQRARPNLLFVTIDALRADHCSAWGYGRPTTPALDRLAAEGVRFARAFASAPMTSPSLPQVFTSAYFPDALSPNLMSSLAAGGIAATKAIVRNPYLEYWLTLNARDGFDSVSPVAWRAGRITDHAIEWVEAHRHERWALYLHYLDTHTPYRTPAPFATQFVDPAYRGAIGDRFLDPDGAQEGSRYDEADRRRIVDLYDGAIRYVDAELGRLFDTLRERGLLDRTLVVVTADHGEELWDHGSFFHGRTLYDHQLHVPLVVRLPAQAHAGTVVDALTRLVDVVPTIAEALDVPAFPEFEGTSLLPLVASGDHAPRDLFARAANPRFPPRFAVRTETHKLVETIEPPAEELFDLVADPAERTNRVADPALAGTRAALRARLADYRRPLADSGFQVRAVAREGVTADVEIVVRADAGRPLANADRVGTVPGDRLSLPSDAKTIAWRAAVGTAPVGFRFDRGTSPHVQAEAGLVFDVRADGAAVPADAIRVGGAGAHPDASPFTYTIAPYRPFELRESPELLTAAAPALTADPAQPVTVYVWRSREAEPASVTPKPVDEAEKARLRALGYVE